MNPDSRETGVDWPAIRALFVRLVDLPDAARAALLQAEPAALRQEVLELLAQHQAVEADADSFLAGAPRLAPVDTPDRHGQRLGSWELLRPLGRGGMGEVWEAQRADGAYAARVAVKVLRHGMNSELLLRRFGLEQRLLARMDHPNVARMLDAGRTDEGRPYFVLEFVPGQPIDQACHGLVLADRLALFCQLADAVSHAHRNLLLHRDIKPGNVLVTDDGQVKLLDFGIAKALDPLEGDDTDMTLAGGRSFTPAYASPEQVRGEPVSTATDVYSLGVLLYVMLTGNKPYGREARTAGEAAQQVLVEPPLRASELPEPAQDNAAGYDPQWPAIRRALRGDLDNILLKALAKPLAERYTSADAMADDLRAWVAGRPVSAHPASTAYLTARFVRRNRFSVAAAALALLALLGGMAAMSWQTHQTELARRAAEKRFADVRQLANRLVFRYHDQIVNLPGSLPVREALLTDAVTYLDGLAQEVGDDSALALELADAYQRVSVLQGEVFSPGQERIAEAETNLDKALALLPRALANTGPPSLTALTSAADMWMGKSTLATRRGRMTEALQALQASRSYVQQARKRAPDDLQVMSRLATLDGRLGLLLGGSNSMATLGRFDEAKLALERSLSLFQQMLVRDPENPEWTHQLAWAYSNLANWSLLNGRYKEATDHAERTVTLRDAVYAARPDNTHYRHQTATARSALASALAYSGQTERALQLHDQVEATVRNTAVTDTGNRSAQRDVLLIGLTRGRTQLLGGQFDAARRTLAPLLAGLAALPTTPDDFYLLRWRAEGHLWLARASLADDPTSALAAAEAAQALISAPPGTDTENATRRWLRAQAIGEQAQALAALGRTEAARKAAGAARDAWLPVVPGSLLHFAARDRALAESGVPKIQP